MLSEKTRDYLGIFCTISIIGLIIGTTLSILIILPWNDMQLREKVYKEAPYKNQEIIKLRISGDKGVILNTGVNRDYNRYYIIRTKNLEIIELNEYEIEAL